MLLSEYIFTLRAGIWLVTVQIVVFVELALCYNGKCLYCRAFEQAGMMLKVSAVCVLILTSTFSHLAIFILTNEDNRSRML